MKSWIVLIALISILAVASLAIAPENAGDRAMMVKEKPYLQKLLLSAKGIAVNPINLDEYYSIALTGGVIKSRDGNAHSRGLMKFQGVKYNLLNFQHDMNAGTINVDVYDGADSNTAQMVGSLFVRKGSRETAEVWSGNLSLNGTNWHVYLLGVQRELKTEELAEKARDYCKENPRDDRCKSVSGYVCKDNNLSCFDKVERFCADHNADDRCKALSEMQCERDSDDSRCRQTMKVRDAERNPEPVPIQRVPETEDR